MKLFYQIFFKTVLVQLEKRSIKKPEAEVVLEVCNLKKETPPAAGARSRSTSQAISTAPSSNGMPSRPVPHVRTVVTHPVSHRTLRYTLPKSATPAGPACCICVVEREESRRRSLVLHVCMCRCAVATATIAVPIAFCGAACAPAYF